MPETPMTDAEFRQLCMRTLAEHDTRHADHEARMATHEAAMAKMDRQYEKLLEVQLDLARSHDEHEGKMEQLRRMQQGLRRGHEEHAERMAHLEMILDAIKELLRERRNGGKNSG